MRDMDHMHDMDKTTIVLTVDLPGDLSVRLKQALRRNASRTLHAITVEALMQWLDRDESDAPPIDSAPTG